MTEGRGDFREYEWNEVIYGSLKRGSGWLVCFAEGEGEFDFVHPE